MAETRAEPANSPPFNIIPRRTNWWILPSWFGSILFHVVLWTVILFVSQLPIFRKETAGDGGQDFRYAGIELLPPGPIGDPGTPSGQGETPGPNHESPVDPTTPQAAAAATAPLPASTSPPIPLSLPTPAGMIGPGAGPALPPSVMDSLGIPSGGIPGGEGFGGIGSGSGGIGGAGTGTGGGGGGTSFMGIQGVGKRFVYVIDRSFSMASDNALQAAKLELLSSLQRLDEAQQFQVIFYNTEFATLRTRGGRFDMFRGTDAQRLQVMEQLREIAPAEGTRHLPPLIEALSFKPDVIFLLSDGDATTALDSKDLSTLRSLNRGRTQIHCIEFGRLSKPPLGEGGNFLKTIARENGGQYVYRNVKAGF